MPPQTLKLADVRSFRVEDRIAAANDFVEAGYEVNVNFGPVIVKEGRQRDYIELFGMLDATLSQAAQAELAAEVIFLTRSEELREVNFSWRPKGRGCSGVRRSRRRRSRRQAATGCFAAKRGSNAASCESSGLRLRGQRGRRRRGDRGDTAHPGRHLRPFCVRAR